MQLYNKQVRKEVVQDAEESGYWCRFISFGGSSFLHCSNSIRMTIEMMMEYARLDSYLDFIISNQDVEKPKPDPEIYQTAMKQLQLQPDECLICEDNDNGIKAALASNGHLMTIRTVDDVNYDAIKDRDRKSVV